MVRAACFRFRSCEQRQSKTTAEARWTIQPISVETCRAAYPSGPAAHLLDTLEAEQKASLERNG